jgi:site-specific DNA recombinase
MHERKPRAFIYTRKSTEGEDRQALSIDSQISELALYASKMNLSIERVFRESQSAKEPGRPVFEEMMQIVGGKGADVIICWKLDRLARNPIDGGRLIWALERREVTEIQTPHHSFKNTSDDKFWMQLEFGMAKKYVDDLSENVKRGLRHKLASGWFPGKAPLGYFNDRNLPKSGRQIIPDPVSFPLVRLLWDRLLTGKYSINRLGIMAEKEMRFPRPPSRSTLFDLFRNPFYSGRFLYKGVLYQASHDPMVTAEEFEKAQRILKKRKKPQRKGRKFFAFSGLLLCGQCGAMVTAEEKHKYIISLKMKRRFIYYHCYHPRNCACRQCSITEPELCRQIDAYLSQNITPHFLEARRQFQNGNDFERRTVLMRLGIIFSLTDGFISPIHGRHSFRGILDSNGVAYSNREYLSEISNE